MQVPTPCPGVFVRWTTCSELRLDNSLNEKVQLTYSVFGANYASMGTKHPFKYYIYIAKLPVYGKNSVKLLARKAALHLGVAFDCRAKIPI